MLLYLRLLIAIVPRMFVARRNLLIENLVLRQQLAVYARRRQRPPLRDTDRLFWSLVARTWSPWRSTLQIVRPETVVRWHRTAWRRYWTWKSQARRQGRPRVEPHLQELIRRMAGENRRWGTVRIQGELRALGYEVSARTIRHYRRKALRRPPSQSWRTFLRNHAPHIWAVDLFTVQTMLLQTVYVVVFIEHGRRRILHFNVTRHPTAPWIWRQLLEATPWGEQPKYLIRDRDSSYGKDFIPRAARSGIQTLLSPMRAPNASSGPSGASVLTISSCSTSVTCVAFSESTSSTTTECARIGRSRLIRPRGGRRSGGPVLLSCVAGPCWEDSITSTNGPREFCRPTTT